MLRYLVILLGISALPVCGEAQSRLPGPIPAELVRVIDGDTIRVRAHIWLGQSVEVSVRLAHVDTPERRGADCTMEKFKGEIAHRAVEQLVSPGLTLTDIHQGTYAGRVIAEVITADGVNIGEYLLEEDLAVPYGEPGGWCPDKPTPSAETASSAAP